MNLPLPRSLRFQIAATLSLVILLFAGATAHTLFTVEQQRVDYAVLNLAGQLQLTVEHLATQAMNYKDNAPRDYETYYRDLKLYYSDLKAHMATFDSITQAFMMGVLPPELSGLGRQVTPSLDAASHAAIEDLETTWDDFRRDLVQALGEDPNAPRLEWAAEHVIGHHDILQQATQAMTLRLQRRVDTHLNQIKLINRTVLLLALAIFAVAMVWFYLHVLGPLRRAVLGFRRVSQGDFGHQLAVGGRNELAEMTEAFNRLSIRLYALFRLIDKLQQGGDLDATVGVVWEEFREFLPMDWIGALFVSSDGQVLRLEKAHANGQARTQVPRHFPLRSTALAQALTSGEPLNVSDLDATGADRCGSGLARMLREGDMHSAIFLPLGGQGALPGFLAFATREAGAYTPQHLELLSNIAHLVTHSFGRTAKLAERARLAAIGEFASGIAHEIRNPLSTIGLALEYLQGIELPEGAGKRVDLAHSEVGRMERLLEDILLYAKPLALDFRHVELKALLTDFLAANRELATDRGQHFQLTGPEVSLRADRDRLIQVFLNLARNACAAAPRDTPIDWTIVDDPGASRVRLQVHNGGEPIPQDLLPRLSEAFVTTRPQGTGLGLAIVRRLIEAHGGELSLESRARDGTTVTVTLPRTAPEGL